MDVKVMRWTAILLLLAGGRAKRRVVVEDFSTAELCLLPRLWSSRCRCALVPGAKVPSSDFEAAPAPSLSIVCSTAAMRSPKRTCVDDDVVVSSGW